MQTLTALSATTFLALTLGWPAMAAPAATDWHQWRGPNRDGKSPDTGLLKEWPEGGPRLAWKAAGLGRGYSGVSVSGNRLFTMGDKDGASHILAVDLKDGTVLWQTKLGKAGAPGWGNFAGPRCTPTVDGNLVFAVDQWGELLCVDTDGKEQWRKHYEKDFGASRPEWGWSESPLVDGENVIVTPGGPQGAVVALNKKTGATVWQSKDFTDPAHYSSVVVAVIGGVRQYLQLTERNVVGLGTTDGQVLWQHRRKGATAVIPDPIYADGHVYVTSGYGIGCHLFKITANSGAFSAEQVYANKVMVNHHGGVVKVGDHLYGHSDGKGWMCQNFKTGEEVWSEKEKLKKGSITYADGLLICREEDANRIALLEATPNGYKERGKFTQPGRAKEKSWPHPTISGGKLYLRDQDILLCYDLKAKE